MLTLEDFRDFFENPSETLSEPSSPDDDTHDRSSTQFQRPGRTNPKLKDASSLGKTSFARHLMRKVLGEEPQKWARDTLLKADSTALKYMPEDIHYVGPGEKRGFHTLIIEFERPATEILSKAETLFRNAARLDLVEDALDRFGQAALRGLHKYSGKAHAHKRGHDVPQAPPEETVVVLSCEDDRATTEETVHLVHFVRQSGEAELDRDVSTMESFDIRQEAILWEPQLAEDYLHQIFERYLRPLQEGNWTDAFSRSEERRLANILLDTADNQGVDDETPAFADAAVELLDEVALSFGLPENENGHRIKPTPLPKDHDIGADPDDAEAQSFENPLRGYLVRDAESRLLGYVLYCPQTTADGEALRQRLKSHNRFHNVLVLYPGTAHDGKFQVRIGLWKGRDELKGRLLKAGAEYQGAARIVSMLSRFFVVSKAEVRNPNELAEELAYRARYLRGLAARELNEQRSGPLRDLYDDFTHALMHDQSEADFADAYAQTITYGLLAARWIGKESFRTENRRFDRGSAREQIELTSPFLRDLFETVLDSRFDPKQAWLVDDIINLLHRIDIDRVFANSKSRRVVSPDPVIHFYEPFLAAYDSEDRRERGVFYTPDPIVAYMVTEADRVLGESSKSGLSEGGVSILDPASGTGTFLKFALEHWVAENDGVSESCIDEFVRELHGFEIMVAPYVICHLRLTLLLRRCFPDKSGGLPKLDVRLSDALELPREPRKELFNRAPALANEAACANRTKARSDIDVVLGNPPYRNNSDDTLNQVAQRFPRLLATSDEASGAQERNIRDDYAWFFAAADSYLSEGGCLCFVTSDSYLKKSSYYHFRKELLKKYRVFRVTRLGTGVFENVGPRIGFAVICMVKRDEPIVELEDIPPIEFVDISPLGESCAQAERGTDQDPRFEWLMGVSEDASAVSDQGAKVESFEPNRSAGYRLLKSEGVGQRLELQVVESKRSVFSSVFKKKWPGVITAFDTLFKSGDRSELTDRMKRFFELSKQGDSSGLKSFGESIGCTDKQRDRIQILADQVRVDGIVFDSDKLKPTFSGSIANEKRWYPPIEHAEWLYYEPSLDIPRNVNPGKRVGWGSMQQWRNPASHEVFPKLVFTTSTNKKYGFHAYVIDRCWYTKLHGGSSQQYHYTSLHDPTSSGELSGKPNNLSPSGLELWETLVAAGFGRDALLHYIAGIYNSDFGEGYVRREAESMLPLPEFGALDLKEVSEIVSLSRKLRQTCGCLYLRRHGNFPKAVEFEELACKESEVLRGEKKRDERKLSSLVDELIW